MLMDLTKQIAPKHVHRMDSDVKMVTVSMSSGVVMAKMIVKMAPMRSIAFQLLVH